MSKLTRREAVAAVAAAGLAFAGTSGRTYSAEPEKVLSADKVVRENVEGNARVEIVVDGWVTYRGATAGPGESQTLVLKRSDPEADRLDVVVNQKVFARLAALGIEDPKKHFEGKTLIVAGKVHRNLTPGGISIIIWVNDLAQIESIAKK